MTSDPKGTTPPVPTGHEVAILRARVADLERFISRLGHDLSTPLTTITGFASLLARDPSLSPATLDAVTRMHRSADRASGLLRALVDETSMAQADSLSVTRLVEESIVLATDIVGPIAVGVAETSARVFCSASATRSLMVEILTGLAGRTAPDPLEVEIEVLAAENTDAVFVSFLTARGPLFTAAEREALDHGVVAPVDEQDPTLASILTAARLATTQAGRLWAEDVEDGGLRLVASLPRSTAGG